MSPVAAVRSATLSYRPLRSLTPPTPPPKPGLFERIAKVCAAFKHGLVQLWPVTRRGFNVVISIIGRGVSSFTQGLKHFGAEIGGGLTSLKRVFVQARKNQIGIAEIRIIYGLALGLLGQIGLWLWAHHGFQITPHWFELSSWLAGDILPLIFLSIALAFGRPLWITVTACYALAVLVLQVQNFFAYHLAAPWDPWPRFYSFLAMVGMFGASFYAFQDRWLKRQAEWAGAYGAHITVTEAIQKAKQWMVAQRQRITEKSKTLLVQAGQKTKAWNKQSQQWIKEKKKQAQKLPGQYQKSYARFSAQLPGKLSKQKAKMVSQLKAEQAAWVRGFRNLPKVCQGYQKKISSLIKFCAGRAKSFSSSCRTVFKNALRLGKGKIMAGYKFVIGQIKSGRQKVVKLPRLIRTLGNKAKGWVRTHALKARGQIKMKIVSARRGALNAAKLIQSQRTALPKAVTAWCRAQITNCTATIRQQHSEIRQQLADWQNGGSQWVLTLRQDLKQLWQGLSSGIKTRLGLKPADPTPPFAPVVASRPGAKGAQQQRPAGAPNIVIETKPQRQPNSGS